MNSKDNYFNPKFSHIYVEKRVQNHPRTLQVLAHFPKAKIIIIDHYKDVFNRRGQDIIEQHRAQNLILASKEGTLFYEGAPVCQNFGNENFYYCSTMMNCIFDCSYCYLKGMYPSGHLVIFVNLEDYFSELDRILAEKSLSLCVSYDADLLALEALTGYGKLWVDYASNHANLKIEIRTKNAGLTMWQEFPITSNVIFAFTLAPQPMIDMLETGTPSVKARIDCALSGLEKGFHIRFCFDPMMYHPGWKEYYDGLLAELDRAFTQKGVSMNRLSDVSVGTFRISQDYMKKIRKAEPESAAVQFPYENRGGVYQDPDKLRNAMEKYLIDELEKRMDREKIYYE